VIPGVAFGRSPYLRIANALDTDDLKTAFRDFLRACNALS
jgi:aspartate/methionine/tyrosine aminotransferase